MKVKEMSRKARAFVLLAVDLGKEEKVMEKLLKFDEVKEAHVIPGEKDLMIVLETEREIIVPNSTRISDFVTNKIARIPGVLDTETILPTKSKIKSPE
jgi:DNA-binding Lrp family transcriptional regulator